MKPIYIPGKTFLFGEYIATQGEHSLVFTSTPCFCLSITSKKNDASMPFHPESPAGLLYHEHSDLLSSYHLSFENPYQRGGLGASTAEFLGLYLFLSTLKKNILLSNKELVSFYQAYNIKGGIAPSGADLIAQYHKGLSFYSAKMNKQQSFNWPFPALSLLLFHTNQKLATHEHLDKITLPPDLSKLLSIAENTYDALAMKDPTAFIDGINHYGNALRALELEADHTFKILKSLQQDKRILATKGCGAMGADVFMVLCDQADKHDLINTVTKQNYPLIATETELCN